MKEGLREPVATGVHEGTDSAVAAASLGKHAAVSAGPGPPRCRSEILLPPSRCRWILLLPSRCRRILRSMTLPPMLLRGILLATLRPQPVKRPILSSLSSTTRPATS